MTVEQVIGILERNLQYIDQNRQRAIHLGAGDAAMGFELAISTVLILLRSIKSR